MTLTTTMVEEDDFDVSSIIELETPEWEADRLLSFVEWLGYTITESPTAASGYSVVGPDGRHLGGYIANSIIAAWQANPEGKKSGGKKSGGAKKSTAKAPAKTPEQKAAEKAQKEAESLNSAQTEAQRAIALIQPDVLEAKSKGKIDAKDIQTFLDAAQSKLSNAKDPKEVRSIIREMKDQITLYKNEATKPPPADQQLRDTILKLKQNLPDATVLAGTKFDESKIQGVIDSYTKQLESASSPDAAKAALKDMRTAITEEKLAQTKAKAEEAKAQKLATVKPPKAPKKASERTAEEWADWYASRWMGDADPERQA